MLFTIRGEGFITQFIRSIFRNTSFEDRPAANQNELDRRQYDNLILAQEIDRLKAENRELRRVATADPLTGLYNRRGGMAELDRMLAPFKRHEHDHVSSALPLTEVSVVIIDVDDFKEVNDVGGHATGDQVLVAIARHLQHEFRSDDIIIRWGGDEFMVYLIGATQETVLKRSQELVAALTIDPMLKLGNNPAQHVTCSIGIAHGKFRTERGAHSLIETLRSAADMAMYEAKRIEGCKSCIATAPDNIDAAP